MKKTYRDALAAGTALGAWCVQRDRKYPVRRELRFANKLVVPGCALHLSMAKLALTEPPTPPQGIGHRILLIPSEDGAPVRLSLYLPKGAPGLLPCLVYFHGGGFYLGDAGYIHRYAAQYAEGARCMVVFVHYRTSDTDPFPTPSAGLLCRPALGGSTAQNWA